MIRRVIPVCCKRAATFDQQRVDDGVLECPSDVGLVLVGRLAEAPQRVQREGFQTAEAEIEPGPIGHRPGNLNRVGVAALCQPRNCGTAGIAQAQHLGSFVECLAGSIVDRFAEDVIAADRIDAHQLGVPAGYQQRNERQFGAGIAQQRSQQVGLHVMHSDRRNPQRPRE